MVFDRAVSDRRDFLDGRLARLRCSRLRQQPWQNDGKSQQSASAHPPSPGLFEDFTPDQHAADFAGAGADLVKLRITLKPAGWIVIDITVAAQTLDRLKRHPGG